jgi:hypothetical protein
MTARAAEEKHETALLSAHETPLSFPEERFHCLISSTNNFRDNTFALMIYCISCHTLKNQYFSISVS